MNPDPGPTLLAIARGAIASRLGEEAPPVAPAEWLQEPAATFVSIHLAGDLRGCVGTLAAKRPLREDVASNARAAAFEDSRFAPLSRDEFRRTDLEVSLLSPMEYLTFESEAHLLTQLRPGVDGLVLEFGWWRGTFLPQVWDQLPDPKAFLAHLKQKAGLPTHFWADDIQIARYTVSHWREKELQESRSHG